MKEETEAQLVKYEADIRKHISIEQQLQIYIDSQKQKIEDIEKDQQVLEKELKEARDELDLADQENCEEKIKLQQEFDLILLD